MSASAFLRASAPLRALRRPLGAVAGAWLVLVVLAAVFAPVLSPYGYDIQALKQAYQPPSAAHWLGTDEFGRDLLTRLIFGARTSLSVSATAIAVSVFCGMVLGAGNGQILFRHLLPNTLAPVLVSAMLATGDAIILEATLGFFGLGAQPPVPSWGGMMSAGSALVFKAPWVILFPGLTVAITVVAINLYGDALIAALDIRSRLRRGV